MYCVLLKNSTQRYWRVLEAGPLDLDSSALTHLVTAPPLLPPAIRRSRVIAGMNEEQ